jgi:hypothetical protein
MPGKLPIDRVREAQDAPKVYDEHRERFASHQAGLRESEDPISGARPDAADDEDGLDPDASLADRDPNGEHESRQALSEPEDPDGP